MKFRTAIRVLFRQKMILRLLLISVASLNLVYFIFFFGHSKAPEVAQAQAQAQPSVRRQRPTDGDCIILDWTAGHGLDPWLAGDCSSCQVTINRSYLPDISDYDAIVFYHWWVTDFPPIETRRPEQLYIMNYLESPQRSLMLNLSSHSHYFNLTMAYRYGFKTIE